MLRAEVEEALVVMMDVVRAGEEVVPHFQIFTPEGDYLIFVSLPDAIEERTRRMQLVQGFMAWKMARGFLLCSEIVEPDAISVAAITRDNCFCALRMIERHKNRQATFGDVEWLPSDCIGDEVKNLLPKKETVLDARVVRELARVFGPHGEFQVSLEKGTVLDG